MTCKIRRYEPLEIEGPEIVHVVDYTCHEVRELIDDWKAEWRKRIVPMKF